MHLIFFFIAGFFDGFDDVDFNMYYGSKIEAWVIKVAGREYFWNPFKSFATAKNIGFFRLDSWHIAKTIWVGLCFAAATYHKQLFTSLALFWGISIPWQLIDLSLCGICWYAGQQLAFLIFNNKKPNATHH